MKLYADYGQFSCVRAEDADTFAYTDWPDDMDYPYVVTLPEGFAVAIADSDTVELTASWSAPDDLPLLATASVRGSQGALVAFGATGIPEQLVDGLAATVTLRLYGAGTRFHIEIG